MAVHVIHIYLTNSDGDFAMKKLEKDLKALPIKLNSVNMRLHSNILCITAISPSLNEDVIRSVLQRFGELIIPFKLVRSCRTNESKGFGWLVFKDIKSAEKCMLMISKLNLQARPLYAGWAGNKITCEEDLSSARTIYVEGLPQSIKTPTELGMYLSKNDDISFCQFIPKKGSQPRYAVVEFKSFEAAEKCVMENNGVAVIDGFLYLTYAIPGYSGDDFVLKRPEHMKRSQIKHGIRHTNEQISSCTTVPEMVPPQLIGMRNFAYVQGGIHSCNHQHYVESQGQPIKDDVTIEDVSSLSRTYTKRFPNKDNLSMDVGQVECIEGKRQNNFDMTSKNSRNLPVEKMTSQQSTLVETQKVEEHQVEDTTQEIHLCNERSDISSTDLLEPLTSNVQHANDRKGHPIESMHNLEKHDLKSNNDGYCRPAEVKQHINQQHLNQKNQKQNQQQRSQKQQNQNSKMPHELTEGRVNERVCLNAQLSNLNKIAERMNYHRENIISSDEKERCAVTNLENLKENSICDLHLQKENISEHEKVFSSQNDLRDASQFKDKQAKSDADYDESNFSNKKSDYPRFSKNYMPQDESLKAEEETAQKEDLILPKEKLFRLQQKIKKQADVLEILMNNSPRNDLKRESDSTVTGSKLKKPCNLINKSSSKPKKKRRVCQETSVSLAGKEIQLLKKSHATSSLSTNEKTTFNVKEKGKRESLSPPQPQKIRLARKPNRHDDIEIKEKRPRLEKNCSFSQDNMTPDNVVLENTVNTEVSTSKNCSSKLDLKQSSNLSNENETDGYKVECSMSFSCREESPKKETELPTLVDKFSFKMIEIHQNDEQEVPEEIKNDVAQTIDSISKVMPMSSAVAGATSKIKTCEKEEKQSNKQ
ncbi:cylicin-1-like [Xenia sp. Carnegie-2017]|uniref:cylicin-1-like n=1 Tax=Xenia sp. Carnegie-2017 TaxID=2897299 RepID=UPI001F03AC82|nr:cylicin-1-like [Xenia sp. Carnegie-2017]